MSASIQKYNVSQIVSKFLKPALTSHYQVEIPLPSGVQGFIENRIGNDLNAIKDTIMISCIEASLPGSSLATIDIDNDYHGISERHAYRRIYDDRIDFTFLVDGTNYLMIRFFEAWKASTINEQFTDFDNSYYTYRVAFPKTYYSQKMTIKKFERDLNDNNTLEYTFINCFPISINSMPVSYEQPSLLKCTVSLSYSRYRVSKITDETTTNK